MGCHQNNIQGEFSNGDICSGDPDDNQGCPHFGGIFSTLPVVSMGQGVKRNLASDAFISVVQLLYCPISKLEEEKQLSLPKDMRQWSEEMDRLKLNASFISS